MAIAAASILGVAVLFAAIWRTSHRPINIVDRIRPYTMKQPVPVAARQIGDFKKAA